MTTRSSQPPPDIDPQSAHQASVDADAWPAIRAASKQDYTTAARAVGRHHLGAQLRQLRQTRSLRLADVAARLEIVPSTLSRMETGKAPVRAAYLSALLDLYRVHDQAERAQLKNLASDGRRKSWHDAYRHLLPAGASHYLDLETAATHLRSYSVHAIPGLAQTAGYAATAIRAARPGLTQRQVRDLVALQLLRQDHARSAGHQMHLVIDESALLRLAGTAKIMASQLSHLHAISAAPGLTLQVAELNRRHPVLSTPFTILSFPGPGQPDVACHAGAALQVTTTTQHAHLRALHGAFTTLASMAASPDDSAKLILNAVTHWESQVHHDHEVTKAPALPRRD